MPEILTKHPDVVFQVLESQGARCGDGIKPKILTRCPTEKFCTLSGGEFCVFGAQEIDRMTQLSRAEVCGAPASPKSAGLPGAAGMPALIALGVALGLAALRVRHSRVSRRPKRASPPASDEEGARRDQHDPHGRMPQQQV